MQLAILPAAPVLIPPISVSRVTHLDNSHSTANASRLAPPTRSLLILPHPARPAMGIAHPAPELNSTNAPPALPIAPCSKTDDAYLPAPKANFSIKLQEGVEVVIAVALHAQIQDKMHV